MQGENKAFIFGRSILVTVEPMTSEQAIAAAHEARSLYERRLKAALETTHAGDFVAIDLESGDYFLGKTLSEAIQSARAAHPDRLPFALRIGHRTTVELGVMRL